MRLSLTRKLFGSFLALTVLVLVATLGLARWSFERGFLDYVNALDRNRLAHVAADLAEYHTALGNTWDGLDETDFERILARYQPRRPPPLPGVAPSASAPAVPTADPGLPGPQTALFDVDGRQIAGSVLERVPDRTLRYTILAADRAIGELQALVHRRVSAPVDSAFSRQQGRRGLAIGAFALVLAALISWWLARGLLAPIRASNASVARLSAGDYTPHATAATEHRDGDELARLASDLERLRATLEAGRDARRRLLADISHELRTPLTILAGEIGAMRDGVRPLDAEQLASIDEEVVRLRRLVDDLHELSLSDIGGLRYEFRRLRIEDCVEESIAALRGRASERGIDIDVSVSGAFEIEGDVRRLHQLFTNLLGNAIAYTDPPGRIAITIAAEGGAVRVTLEDTPPGVGDGAHERLFESLYRDEGSRSRRRGGSGLGLAICRNIVAAHRGRITASPSRLGGLRIDIHLPLERGRDHARADNPGRRGRDEDRVPGARLPAA